MVATLFFLALTLGSNSGDELARSALHLPDDGSLVAVRALRQPGLKDLLIITPTGVSVRTQDARGFFLAEAVGKFNWPSEHLAWDVVDFTGAGLFELVILGGDGRVMAYAVEAQGAFGEGRLLLESQSYLPRGVARMRFARDVNADGLIDLVLPAAGLFRVHLQQPSGAFAEPLEIEYDAEVSYSVGDPRRLDAKFGQELSIPFFTLEDVDGDGLQDLVSKTEERVDFHLATPEISQTPTWSLDLVALAESLPKLEGVNLDDLMANIEQGVKWSLEDVDGQAPRDLVLQLGATMRIYLGGSTTGTSKRPDQVLKISGNLLHYFLRDVQGSELPDLQLLRGERISLGRALRWLILPGSLDFEFFTYVNTGGAFSSKPTRRNTLTLEIPRLLSLMDELEEIGEGVAQQFAIPAQRADFDGDGEATGVVDLVNGKLRLYRGIAPEEPAKFRALEQDDLSGLLEVLVLDDVNRLDDGATKTIDLGNISSWNFSPSTLLRQATQGEVPFLTIEDKLEGQDPKLRVLDLDGDGRDDVIAWVTLEDDSHLLHFFVQAGP